MPRTSCCRLRRAPRTARRSTWPSTGRPTSRDSPRWWRPSAWRRIFRPAGLRICRSWKRSRMSDWGGAVFRRKDAAALSILLALIPVSQLRAQEPNELLRLADEPRKAYREALIRVRVTNFEHGQPGPASEFDLYKKGEVRALIVFRTGTQKGRKILTVGEKFWLVVPGAKHAIPVSANQR